MRLGHALARSLGKALRTHGGEIDARRQRAQRLVRADVAAGLLAADVLLARLQRQDKTALAARIDRLADDTARQLAHVLRRSGHEAEIRAAPAEGHAKRLALTDGDIRAALLRRFQDAEGNGVTAEDIQRARCMDDLAERFGVLKLAEEVRLLDAHAGDVPGRQKLAQGVRIGLSVLDGDDAQLVARAVAIGADGVDDVGMGRAGDQLHAALAVAAHGCGLGGGGRAVIDGCIGDVHARQLADHGLIFKDGLEDTLAQLRLIGRVGCQKLLLRRDILHDGGDVVVIGSGAAENGGKHTVLPCQLRHGPPHLQLAHAGRQIERPVQIHGRGHIAVELAEVVQADGLQHLLPLFGRVGNIAAHVSPPARRRPRRQRRPAVLPYRSPARP